MVCRWVMVLIGAGRLKYSSVHQVGQHGSADLFEIKPHRSIRLTAQQFPHPAGDRIGVY